MPNSTTSPAVDTVDDLRAVFFDLLQVGGRTAIPTAVDHAYEMIWRQLIRGERQPGERLTDTELALQLGLSRISRATGSASPGTGRPDSSGRPSRFLRSRLLG